MLTVEENFFRSLSEKRLIITCEIEHFANSVKLNKRLSRLTRTRLLIY